MLVRSFAFRFVAFLSLGALFFSSCSTDLDSNADYKEVMVIYSVLDPAQTVHYAKVNKAFLNTNSNALTIAANNPDSTQYGEEVQVVLQELRTDSSVIAEQNMESFISTGKEPGVFFSGDQVMYRTTGTVMVNTQSIYRIVATNTKTGVKAYGATNIVKDIPETSSKPFCIYNISKAYAINNTCLTETLPTKFDPQLKGNTISFNPSSAKIYTVKLTFKFTETTNGVTQNKEVQWYIRNNYIISGSTVDEIIQLENDYFINNLLALIDRSQDNATTERKAGDVFITVTGGSSSLELYYRINNSFSIISQTRPEYDNITNGTGLVASRRSKTARGVLTPDAIKYLQAYPQLKFKP